MKLVSKLKEVSYKIGDVPNGNRKTDKRMGRLKAIRVANLATIETESKVSSRKFSHSIYFPTKAPGTRKFSYFDCFYSVLFIFSHFSFCN